MNTRSVSVLCELISRMANTPLTIRISGETGVGKEAVARLLYRYHPHDRARFNKIDCRQLITATANCPTTALNNILDAPQGSVLYLENTDAAPKEIQNRLLELLSRDFSSNPPWIMASSRRPLEQFLGQNRFSTPLFNELNTLHIVLPPIRSMPTMIPQMLTWFLNHFNSETPSRTLPMPGKQNMERLMNHTWPGNWRQVEMAARKAFDDQTWSTPIGDWEPGDGDGDKLDSVAAIHILSMAKLDIRKSKVIEKMVSGANQNEIGLMDLVIFNEAVNQMAEHIGREDNDKDKDGLK